MTNAASRSAVGKLLFDTEQVSKVDFSEHLVSIDSKDANDPNVQRWTFVVDGKGTLSAEAIATQMGFAPSPSRILKIYLVPGKGLTKCRSDDAHQQRYVVTPVR